MCLLYKDKTQSETHIGKTVKPMDEGVSLFGGLTLSKEINPSIRYVCGIFSKIEKLQK